jgi:sirohydrochlorin cobaltochelatase
LTGPGREIGLLLAAHGERREGATNQSVELLAAELRARGIVAEVRVGFVKGVPTIPDAMGAFSSAEVLVYPLFLADGHFTRVRLPELIGASPAREWVRTLPPLGVDPALAGVVAEKAVHACHSAGYEPKGTWLALIAHGSAIHAASRCAADELAARIGASHRFAGLASAFLEEGPPVAETLRSVPGPVVVVGLFAGEGLHGREDIGRFIDASQRSDVISAGNVGTWPEVADLAAAAIAGAGQDHSSDKGSGRSLRRSTTRRAV